VTEAAIRGEGVFAEPAILFSDIRRFTSLSESMPPEALLKLLNRYLSYMADTILRRDGHIDKYIGDAIMALFGVPQNLKCNAESAVCACIEMLEALEFLNDESGRLGQPLLEIGLGVATGPVIAGNVGPLNRRNFTVIGDPVNLASRIEGLTKPYGARILIDGNTFAALPDKYPGRRIDVVQVKGQNKPTTLYEILYQLPTGGDTERWLDLYGNGLRLYEAGQFSKGASELEKVVQLMPSDKAAAILLDRCRKLMASPPPDWQGVWRMDSKEG
jgi:adenylate cyclase